MAADAYLPHEKQQLTCWTPAALQAAVASFVLEHAGGGAADQAFQARQIIP
jgi:hypothetical protein